MIYQSLSREIRMQGAPRFRIMAMRLAVLLALALVLPVSASAYTVVLRSGRRVQIPDQFNVTRLTLTYEAAPGINITLQMASIDVAATDRANGEAAGSLLRRIRSPFTQHAPGSGGGGTTVEPGARPRRVTPRTLTNRDLESSRRTRLESERAYEARRARLGLPSAEETRRRSEEDLRLLHTVARQSEEEGQQAEAYWRGRATALRSEMAALNAEIAYLRTYLAETGESSNVFIAPHTSPYGIGNNYPYGTQTTVGGGGVRGAIIFGSQQQSTVTYNGIPQWPGPWSPYGGPYNYPSHERSILSARLQELEARRAGMEERWRTLEEEARRAGAPPGWLRP